MTRLKHNKKRNTAFLYEALVRELTKTVVGESKQDKSTIISILKEHFDKNTTLFKELELYKALLESDSLPLHVAEKLIFEVKRNYASLNKKKIFNEQSAVISKINKSLTNGVFANFVPNYKNIATISQIFSDEDIAPKKRVILEQSIVDLLTKKEKSKKLEENMKPIDNLVFKSFIKNFNSEYSELYDEQRALLNVFISSFKDGGSELNAYLNEELGRLKKEVKNALTLNEIKQNEHVKEKFKNLLEFMEKFKEKRIDKPMLQKILKIQQLVKEIKN